MIRFFNIFILTFFLPSLLCCDIKETYELESEPGKFKVVFHGICDLGVAVINNELDMVADKIGQNRFSLLNIS